jgi:hydroxyacylglutathione hydrolase
MLEIIQLPVLTDNYIYVIHEPESKETAVIDPAVAQPVLDLLKDKGWTLNTIFNTHHHSDHTGANVELKAKTQCQIFGFGEDRARIPALDTELKHDDEIKLGHQRVKVIATPGHTTGHIVYFFADHPALFCGDTLFSMGCGRLFEGTAQQMWHSLQQIKNLPPNTQIYCAHEYTQANARFALTLEPDNQALIKRAGEVDQLRIANQPTIPSMLKHELATNPFLREDSLAIQASVGMSGKPAVDVFRKIRALKDSF